MMKLPRFSGEALDLFCSALDIKREGDPFGVKLAFIPWHFCIGVFWNQAQCRLYVMVLPMIGMVIQFSTLESDEDLCDRAVRTLDARSPFPYYNQRFW